MKLRVFLALATMSLCAGAPIAGAKVTITNAATNATRNSSTNGEGIYTFPALVPGTYTVKIDKAGFKSYSQSNIELQVQANYYALAEPLGVPVLTVYTKGDLIHPARRAELQRETPVVATSGDDGIAGLLQRLTSAYCPTSAICDTECDEKR